MVFLHMSNIANTGIVYQIRPILFPSTYFLVQSVSHHSTTCRLLVKLSSNKPTVISSIKIVTYRNYISVCMHWLLETDWWLSPSPRPTASSPTSVVAAATLVQLQKNSMHYFWTAPRISTRNRLYSNIEPALYSVCLDRITHYSGSCS
jgi:hypothetical protein